MSLGSEQLRAYYQPIVNLGDLLDIAGHEALVRWEHPTHGLLPPDRFLELAESSGLIRSLGMWMLAQACEDAAKARLRTRPRRLGRGQRVPEPARAIRLR